MSKTLKFGIIILAILCLALLALTIFELPGRGNGDLVAAQPESTPEAWEDSDLANAVLSTIEQSEDWLPEETYIIDYIQYQMTDRSQPSGWQRWIRRPEK